MKLNALAWVAPLGLLGHACANHGRGAEDAPREVAEPGLRPRVYEPMPAAGSAHEWAKLGEVRDSGASEHGTVSLKEWDERFRFLRIRFDSERMQIDEVWVEFTDGARWSPRVPPPLQGAALTFALPPGTRAVRAIHFRYQEVRGAGPVHVEVWGT